MSFVAATSVSADSFPFYAVYDRVADLESLDFEEIYNSLLSNDGQRLVVYGRSRRTGQLALVTLAADGSAVTEVTLPPKLNGIRDAAISHRGRRVFLLHAWSGALYKLEAGQVSKVFDAADHGEVSGIDQIHSAADGEWVYFREPRHSIWRVGHDGGLAQRLFTEKEVARDGGVAANIGLFRVSADGATLAFTMQAYWDDRGGHHVKHEVFSWRNGSIRQLTDDARNIFKERLALSGDGRVVAYTATRPQNKLWAINADGTDPRALNDIVMVGPVVLDQDGSHLYYYDQANGGRVERTDGSGGNDLFPAYNVQAIPLQSPWSLAVTDSGDRIGFRIADAVYVGHIGDANAVSGAAVIEQIIVDPPVSDAGRAALGTTVRARVREGHSAIVRTQTNTLRDGKTDHNDQTAAVVFHVPVNDAGAAPDRTAGDGIFSTRAWPGKTPTEFARTRVRVAVMGEDFTVTLADAPLTGATLAAASAGDRGGLEVGINRPGADFRNFTTSDDPAACQRACLDDERCVAFTHVRAGVQGPAARCWLKNDVPAPVRDAGCVSGTRAASADASAVDVAGLTPDAPGAAVATQDVAPSTEQGEVIELLGPPPVFRISYLPLGEDATHLVRYETWAYPEFGQEVTFAGGHLIDTRIVEFSGAADDEVLANSNVRPESVLFEMDLAELTALIGSDDLQRIDSLLFDSGPDGMEIYLGDNVLFYLQDGYVLHFEAFATGSEP